MIGRRELKKARTWSALAKAAMRLALERGVENVTAEAIAAAADVAPRTFHNYFSSKEEAIVAELLDRFLGFADLLRARPADEPIWDALRNALATQVSGPPEELAEWAAKMRMIQENRSLCGPQLALYEQSSETLSTVIAERTGTDVERDLYPCLLASVVIVAMRIAMSAWLTSEGRRSVVDLAVDALNQLRAGLPQPGVTT